MSGPQQELHLMAQPDVVIGLDIGTTSTIAAAVSLPDRILAVAGRPVTLSSPHAGWAEEDPAQWWDNAVAVLREVVSEVTPGRIAGICVTGMLPAVVLLDADGRVLRPSIQQSDGRCGAEVAELGRTRRSPVPPAHRQWHQPAAGGGQAALAGTA